MLNLKRYAIKKIRDPFFVICSFLICLLLLVTFFWPKIKTIIWHVEHPNPISWSKLKVSIPENLVAQKIEEGLDVLIIYSFIAPGYGVTFEKASQSSFQSLIDFFRSQKYLIENIPCKISGENCLWIKATNENQKINYTEEIFIINRGIRISFKGSRNKD